MQVAVLAILEYLRAPDIHAYLLGGTVDLSISGRSIHVPYGRRLYEILKGTTVSSVIEKAKCSKWYRIDLILAFYTFEQPHFIVFALT